MGKPSYNLDCVNPASQDCLESTPTAIKELLGRLLLY